MYRRARSFGFTLVELLVVIAIIGILVALLLPAVQAAREAARRTQCANQLRQIGLAILNFEDGNRRFPAGSTSEGTPINGPYSSTWTVDILPFIEEQGVYDLWNPDAPFVHASNQRLRETFLDIYLCPSDIEIGTLGAPESGPGSGGSMLWAPGSYRGMSGHSLGINGDHYWDNPEAGKSVHAADMPVVWQGPLHVTYRNESASDRAFEPVTLGKIADGTSHTLLVGEYHTITYQSRRTFWAYAYTSYNQSSAFFESRTLIPDYEKCTMIGGGGAHTCKRAWGSLHGGNLVQFVKCDGSVHQISTNVDMDLFAASGTIQNAEPSSL
jgi:prepilin-type N-terminal cleavage/methylation domain-containing protein